MVFPLERKKCNFVIEPGVSQFIDRFESEKVSKFDMGNIFKGAERIINLIVFGFIE